MNRSLTLVLLSILALGSTAQTMFIPDTYLRTWLNNAKPGVVDGSGNCDTVSWNAVPPSSVTFGLSAVPDGGAVDLEAMHCQSMQPPRWLGVRARVSRNRRCRLRFAGVRP